MLGAKRTNGSGSRVREMSFFLRLSDRCPGDGVALAGFGVTRECKQNPHRGLALDPAKFGAGA
jgi:hypothetical protein